MVVCCNDLVVVEVQRLDADGESLGHVAGGVVAQIWVETSVAHHQPVRGRQQQAADHRHGRRGAQVLPQGAQHEARAVLQVPVLTDHLRTNTNLQNGQTFSINLWFICA